MGNRIGRNDTGDHFDGRRFSRPVRPQKAENLSGFRLKREVINRFSRRPSVCFWNIPYRKHIFTFPKMQQLNKVWTLETAALVRGTRIR